MTYQETIDYLFSKLPIFQRIGASAYKANLDNITKLCDAIGNPQDKIKTIHVAGTNGKGSVCHYLASICQEAGYKTGLFSSPHLVDFRERIKINGVLIPESEVVRFVSEIQPNIEEQNPSFFEVTTAMGFWFFQQQQVDIAIIETGMGGRLDSSNIILPLVSVITNIGMDHTQFLGDSYEKIATEKAGIIKPSVPVIIGEFQAETYPVFETIAKNNHAPLYLAENENCQYQSPLLGDFQLKNVTTAVAAIRQCGELSFNENAIQAGITKVIANTGLRGRWEVLQEKPKVICDVGHNKEAMNYLVKELEKENYLNLHIVLAMVNDKSHDEIFTLLPKHATYYFSQATIPRALDKEKLAELGAKHELKGNTYSSLKEAYASALNHANEKDLIFVGGSFFTVAEILETV
jgi:dihydrofolate synthase / folylpolyglutamate synthase